MAIGVPDYLEAVADSLPGARGLLDRFSAETHGIRRVVGVNRGLTLLLQWAWESRDVETCGRILAVMELALVDTDDDEDAPVYNSVAEGVFETLNRDLSRDDLIDLVELCPPAMREIGVRYVASDDTEWCDDVHDDYRLPLSLRVHFALLTPVRTAKGLVRRAVGPKRFAG